MRKEWIVLVFLGVCGCATPARVKEAVKLQSDSYIELQGALQNFKVQYVGLNEHLLHLRQESLFNAEALALIKGFSGQDPTAEGDETWAALHPQEVSEMATKLNKNYANSRDSLDTYRKAIEYFEAAYRHGQATSEKDNQRTRRQVENVEKSIDNLSKDLQALMAIHDDVGEYLNIDLTPDPKLLREAISDVKALQK